MYGDYEDSWDNGHGRVKVEFTDDYNPYVKIRVYNYDSWGEGAAESPRSSPVPTGR